MILFGWKCEHFFGFGVFDYILILLETGGKTSPSEDSDEVMNMLTCSNWLERFPLNENLFQSISVFFL